MSTCNHYQQKTNDGGRCAINAYGKNVMVGLKVCLRCPQNTVIEGQRDRAKTEMIQRQHEAISGKGCCGG